MSRRLLTACALLGVLGGWITASPASAADIVIKAGHSAAATEPYQVGFEHFKKRVEELTRRMDTPVDLGAIRGMRASRRPMAYGEVYTALQQGAMDGAEAANTTYEAQKFYGVAPNWAMVAWTTLVSDMIMGEKFFQSLPADVQKAVVQAAQESARVEREAYARSEDVALATLKAKGVKITTPDPEPFRKAQQSMHLGVDYLLYAVPPRGRAALEVLVHLMVSGFLLLLLVQGIKILDVASVQTSPAMEINMWYAYLALPVGAALMLLESVLKLGESLRALRSPA